MLVLTRVRFIFLEALPTIVAPRATEDTVTAKLEALASVVSLIPPTFKRRFAT